MNKTLPLALSMALSFALGANPVWAQKKTTEAKNLNIVFIGNSITHGGGLQDPGTEAPPVETAAWLRKQNGIGTVAFKNLGMSGHTSVDFLPGGPRDFKMVEDAANRFEDKQAQLLFSIILGTNDSAMKGPNGAPVAVVDYSANLRKIADKLLAEFPDCKIIFHQPTWYSKNTHNKGATYDADGLARLETYFPAIKRVVRSYQDSIPGRVFMGDTRAFGFFKKHAEEMLQHENGLEGVFYLHPNKQGAFILGDYWGKAIYKRIKG